VVHAYNPSTQRLEQENHKSEISLGYIAQPCFKKKTTKKKVAPLWLLGEKCIAQM
jgi:hypothetical protein